MIIVHIVESSVEPDITLYKNGVAQNLTEVITQLKGCLHNGSLDSGDQHIKQGEETRYYCEANYGGTKETSPEFGITFSSK